MSIGVALGGFGQGLREGYAVGKDMRETRDRRRAEEAIAEAQSRIAKPGDPVGSRNVAKPVEQWAQESGYMLGGLGPGGRLNDPAAVQAAIAAGGPAAPRADVQAVPNQSITAGLQNAPPGPAGGPPLTVPMQVGAMPVGALAGLPAPEMVRQSVEQALPQPPSQTQPQAQEPRIQQAPPQQQPQMVTFKDPITGRVMVTDKPRVQTQAGYVRDLAQAYLSVDNPEYRERGITMLAQAEQLQMAEDARTQRDMMRRVLTLGPRWASGDTAAGEELFSAWDDVDDGLTPRLQTNQDGTLSLQMLDNDTGIPAGDPTQFANRQELLAYVFAMVQPENFGTYLQEVRANRQEVTDRARWEFQKRMMEAQEGRAAAKHPVEMRFMEAQIGAMGRSGRGGGGEGGSSRDMQAYQKGYQEVVDWARENNITPSTDPSSQWQTTVVPHLEELATRYAHLFGGSGVIDLTQRKPSAEAGPDFRSSAPEPRRQAPARAALPPSPYGETASAVARPVARAGTAVTDATLSAGMGIVQGVNRLNPFMPRRPAEPEPRR